MTAQPQVHLWCSLKIKLLLPLLLASLAGAGLGVWALQPSLATRLEKEVRAHAEYLADTLRAIVNINGCSPELPRIMEAMARGTDVKFILIVTGEPPSVFATAHNALISQPTVVLPDVLQANLIQTQRDQQALTRWDRQTGEMLYTLPLTIAGQGGTITRLVEPLRCRWTSAVCSPS
ncbi:MAG: hypothetical protein U1F42_01545 [Candidatus Competibacteraceae bacterium]